MFRCSDSSVQANKDLRLRWWREGRAGGVNMATAATNNNNQQQQSGNTVNTRPVWLRSHHHPSHFTSLRSLSLGPGL